jgi:hypothetical protein
VCWLVESVATDAVDLFICEITHLDSELLLHAPLKEQCTARAHTDFCSAFADKKMKLELALDVTSSETFSSWGQEC